MNWLDNIQMKVVTPNGEELSISRKDTASDIAFSNLVPQYVPPLDVQRSAFYHSAAMKVVPPKVDIHFTLPMDDSTWEFFNSLFERKKYYGLYSLKEKSWVSYNKKTVHFKYKKDISAYYNKLKKDKFFFGYYIRMMNIVIKPFWV